MLEDTTVLHYMGAVQTLFKNAKVCIRTGQQTVNTCGTLLFISKCRVVGVCVLAFVVAVTVVTSFSS